MASTATATVTRDQVTGLESEIADLKMKIATEETDLAALKGERTELAEKIALGEAPASKAPALERRIEEVQTRITGLNSVIAKKKASLDSAYPLLRRIEAETKLATRRSEVEVLRGQGTELVVRMNRTLAALITEELPALDAIRDKLMEYRDIGGQEVGAALCRTLLTESGALVEEDKLTNMRAWVTDPPRWKIRGDVVLTVRNLWAPK